jgi:hypothetical protein
VTACQADTRRRADCVCSSRTLDAEGLIQGPRCDLLTNPAPAVTIGGMPVAFSQLRESYPTDRSPCGDGWENQCAIRMSIALQGAGFDFDGYGDPLCSHGHARGAESLANHLWREWGAPRVFRDGSSAKRAIGTAQGIVLFKDISGFRGGTGDHIDLWTGTGTMTGEYFNHCKQVWFFRCD